MIITGMVNSQTVLLTVLVKQQPCCVQVLEGVGLVVFRSLGVFQNFQGDVFYHAFYLGFVLQHMRRSEMSLKVR
jgi:hypothetical protein